MVSPRCQLRPMRTLRPEIPIALERLVERALQKDPGARFASARALLDGIESVRASTRSAVADTAVAVPSVNGRLRLALVAVCVAAIGTGAWYVVYDNRLRAARETLERVPELADRSGTRTLQTAPPGRAAADWRPGVREDATDVLLPAPVRTEPPGAELTSSLTWNPRRRGIISASHRSIPRVRGDGPLAIHQGGYTTLEVATSRRPAPRTPLRAVAGG